MARDMNNIYRFKTLDQLRLLRSQKVQQLERLRGQWLSYYVQQDIKRVAHLIDQLDAELACRRDQMGFL